jgi:hypothetical protein
MRERGGGEEGRRDGERDGKGECGVREANKVKILTKYQQIMLELGSTV